jgi:hypothetical protein
MVHNETIRTMNVRKNMMASGQAYNNLDHITRADIWNTKFTFADKIMDDIKNCPESERPYKHRNIVLNPVRYAYDESTKICTFINQTGEIVAHTKYIICKSAVTQKPYKLCSRQWIIGDNFIAFTGGLSDMSKREKNDYYRVYQRKMRIHLSPSA